MARVGVLIAVLAACGAPPRDAIDAGFLPDASADAAVDMLGVSSVYMCSHDRLYRLDADTLELQPFPPFFVAGTSEGMMDIAVDQYGRIFGVSETALYRISTASGHAAIVGPLDRTLTGLSFVPAALLGQTGEDVLVATRGIDDALFRIDPATGDVTQLGFLGQGFKASDLVAVTGFGTAVSVFGSPTANIDRLVRVSAPSVEGTSVGQIGFDRVSGLAFWKGRLLGVTFTGNILRIDPATGKGTLERTGLPSLYGAAVTTAAPLQ